jgi:hypothetical protein
MHPVGRRCKRCHDLFVEHSDESSEHDNDTANDIVPCNRLSAHKHKKQPFETYKAILSWSKTSNLLKPSNPEGHLLAVPPLHWELDLVF